MQAFLKNFRLRGCFRVTRGYLSLSFPLSPGSDGELAELSLSVGMPSNFDFPSPLFSVYLVAVLPLLGSSLVPAPLLAER